MTFTDAPDLYASEFRRCLLAADVHGMMKLWAHVQPHLASITPSEALISLHMARVDSRRIPLKLKTWSLDWLAERGFQKVDGQWIQGPAKQPMVAEAVGIASSSKDPRFARKIMRAMEDALLNEMAKGVTEPIPQREAMLKAREKIRFKAGIVTRA